MNMLNEMFDSEYQQLNERPYSRAQQGTDEIKSKIKGFFGGGQVEQGSMEAGNMANSLWADFKRSIGRKYGKSMSYVPYTDAFTFFKNNQLDTSVLGKNTRASFSPKDIGQALMKAVQMYFDDFKDQNPDAQPQQSKPQAQKQPEQPVQQQEEPQQSQPVQPAQQSSGGLQGAISKLNKQQRDALLDLLS